MYELGLFVGLLQHELENVFVLWNMNRKTRIDRRRGMFINAHKIDIVIFIILYPA